MGIPSGLHLSPLYAIDVYIAMHYGINGEGSDTFHAQFFLYFLAMSDDGGESDAQLVGYFLVDFALCYQCQHLTFTVGKYLFVVWQVFLGDMLAMWMSTVLEIEQFLDEYWLGHIDTQTMKIG